MSESTTREYRLRRLAEDERDRFRTRVGQLEAEKNTIRSEAFDLVRDAEIERERSEAVSVRLRKALERADDLLRRLDEWDVMRASPDAQSDGPFWRRLIAEAREINRIALGKGDEESHGD